MKFFRTATTNEHTEVVQEVAAFKNEDGQVTHRIFFPTLRKAITHGYRHGYKYAFEQSYSDFVGNAQFDNEAQE